MATVDIRDISGEFDRLCPDQVDDTIAGNGQPEAGHVGHDGDDEEWPCVGWFCAGGNVGNPVVSIHPDDLGIVAAACRAASPGCDIRQVLDASGARIEWRV